MYIADKQKQSIPMKVHRANAVRRCSLVWKRNVGKFIVKLIVKVKIKV